jgi:hypothetical protein
LKQRQLAKSPTLKLEAGTGQAHQEISCAESIEATPGIEIQGKRLSTSRLASNSQSITQLELHGSRLSPVFPLSVHEVVPNPYQMMPLKNAFKIVFERNPYSTDLMKPRRNTDPDQKTLSRTK